MFEFTFQYSFRDTDGLIGTAEQTVTAANYVEARYALGSFADFHHEQIIVVYGFKRLPIMEDAA